MSQTQKNIHQRLAAAMASVSYVQREKKPGMRYSVTSHDSVTALVRPALLEVGIVYYPIRAKPQQTGNRTEVEMTVRFANVDDPKDFIDVETFGYGCDESDKGPGKAMSYSVKYALLKTLGLETGDDPDTDQDSRYKPPEHNERWRTNLHAEGEEAAKRGIDTLRAFWTRLTAAEKHELGGEKTLIGWKRIAEAMVTPMAAE